MLSRSLAVAALAALAACSGNPAEPSPVDRPTVVAGGYTMIKINGRYTSELDPYQYKFLAPGDTLITYAQVTTGIACVSDDGRFSFARGIGAQHIDRAGQFVDDGQQWGGWVIASGTATALGDGSFRWDATMRERPAVLNARHSHDSLTVTIPAESATYLLIEAGPGSPMRDNCKQAGF